jgi:hypothetical protein
MLYFSKVLGLTLVVAIVLAATSTWQLTAQTLPVDDDDLAGVVTGPSGP